MTFASWLPSGACRLDAIAPQRYAHATLPLRLNGKPAGELSEIWRRNWRGP
jgi:hypothetical protein